MAQESRSRQRSIDRQPQYVVRARAGRGWQHVGVAWKRRNGEGLSLKLNVIPVGFDGVLKVLLPLEDEEAHDPETGEVRSREQDDEIPF